MACPLVYNGLEDAEDEDDENEATWGDPIHRLHARVERGGRVEMTEQQQQVAAKTSKVSGISRSRLKWTNFP